MFRSIGTFTLAIFLACAAPARAEEAEIPNAAVLEATDGASPVEVLRAGTWIVIGDGETVVPGESVRTAGSSARLVYGDGSVMALSTDTEVKLEDDPLRIVSLERGTVWGKVEKAGAPALSPPSPAASPSPRPYRFTLRSRAVVMGVRGTEFLVETAPDGEVTVNTLEGAVDTAPDLPTLFAGKGSSVSRFERIRARRGVAFGRAEAFQGDALVSRLKKDHGGLARFLGRPVRRLRPGRGGAIRPQKLERQIRRKAERRARPGRKPRNN